MHSLDNNAYDDGEVRPKKIAEFASRNGLKIASVTAHNSFNATKEFMRAINENPKYSNIKAIPGAEITCGHPLLKGNTHILSYASLNEDGSIRGDIDNSELNKIIKTYARNYRNNKYRVFAALEGEFGIVFHPNKIMLADSKNNYLSDEVIGQMCVEAGYCHNIDDYKNILKPIISKKYSPYQYSKALLPTPAQCKYEQNTTPNIEDILIAMKKADLIPVIAHPSTIQLKNFSKDKINDFRIFLSSVRLLLLKHGFSTPNPENPDEDLLTAGMEICFGSNTKEYYNMCLEFGFIPSINSDFHGPNRALGQRIGTVYGNIEITYNPMADYLTNGRRFENLYISSEPSEYYAKISNKVKNSYKKYNKQIIENRKRRKKEELKTAIQNNKNKELLIDLIKEDQKIVNNRMFIIDFVNTVEPSIKSISKQLRKNINNIENYSLNKKYYDGKINSANNMYCNYKNAVNKLKKDTLHNHQSFKKLAKHTLYKSSIAYEEMIELQQILKSKYEENQLLKKQTFNFATAHR